MSIKDNLDRIRARIEAACRKAGRSADEVQLIGVTKAATREQALELANAGLKDFGENRAHAGEERRRDMPAGLRWHMIGRLQSNKVKKVLVWADVLHSLDRPALAEALEKSLAPHNKALPTFVEINAGGESQKAGVRPEDAESWIRDLRNTCPHLDLKGLMTMAPYDAPESVVRPIFRKLRELRDVCNVAGLSMGMSGDFEVAIEEGATVIRVGSALLEPDSTV